MNRRTLSAELKPFLADCNFWDIKITGYSVH